jgi:hypothetical protein
MESPQPKKGRFAGRSDAAASMGVGLGRVERRREGERERATNPKKDIISVSKEVDMNSMSKGDKDAQTLAPALLRVTLRVLMVLVSALISLATSCTASIPSNIPLPGSWSTESIPTTCAHT